MIRHKTPTNKQRKKNIPTLFEREKYWFTPCVTICPRPPEYDTLFETISLYGRWSTSCSDRGIAHFFIATKNTIKGAGEKEQTNNMLGLIQAQEGDLCNIAFLLCICRLTLAWISCEISTKLLGMPTHLDRSSFTGLHSLSCRCQLATRVTLRQLFFSVPLSNSSRVPLPTSGHVEIAGSGLCLVSRQNRQRDLLLGGPPTKCYTWANKKNPSSLKFFVRLFISVSKSEAGEK